MVCYRPPYGRSTFLVSDANSAHTQRWLGRRQRTVCIFGTGVRYRRRPASHAVARAGVGEWPHMISAKCRRVGRSRTHSGSLWARTCAMCRATNPARRRIQYRRLAGSGSVVPPFVVTNHQPKPPGRRATGLTSTPALDASRMAARTALTGRSRVCVAGIGLVETEGGCGLREENSPTGRASKSLTQHAPRRTGICLCVRTRAVSESAACQRARMRPGAPYWSPKDDPPCPGRQKTSGERRPSELAPARVHAHEATGPIDAVPGRMLGQIPACRGTSSV